MPIFSQQSIDRLDGVHPDLVRLLVAAIKYVDIKVLEGKRSKEKQLEYFESGRSKTMNSKHLEQPDGYAHAVDVAPYPVVWPKRPNDGTRYEERWDAYVQEIKQWYHVFGLIRGLAEEMRLKVRWGGDWDGDFDLKDRNWDDLPHLELVG